MIPVLLPRPSFQTCGPFTLGFRLLRFLTGGLLPTLAPSCYILVTVPHLAPCPTHGGTCDNSSHFLRTKSTKSACPDHTTHPGPEVRQCSPNALTLFQNQLRSAGRGAKCLTPHFWSFAPAQCCLNSLGCDQGQNEYNATESCVAVLFLPNGERPPRSHHCPSRLPRKGQQEFHSFLL